MGWGNHRIPLSIYLIISLTLPLIPATSVSSLFSLCPCLCPWGCSFFFLPLILTPLSLHGKQTGKQWKRWLTIFLGSKITADGDCSREIKRCLLVGRKVMTNLDSILKSRDITLSIKVHLVKTMVFPVVMYGCESWTVKKAEHQRIDAFELWCWRRLLRVPWTARRSIQSILK